MKFFRIFFFVIYSSVSLALPSATYGEFQTWYKNNRNLFAVNYLPKPEPYSLALQKTKSLIRSRQRKIDCTRVESLTDDEKLSLGLYLSTGSRILNAALWEGKSSNLERLEPFSRTLSNALRKLPSQSGWVYRYAALNAQLLAQYTKGKAVTFLGFTSTSVDSKWPINGASYGNVLFQIQTKSGKDVQCLSPIPYEMEWLIDKGARFTVSSFSPLGNEKFLVVLIEDKSK